jgi:integrase/recombinase XerD
MNLTLTIPNDTELQNLNKQISFEELVNTFLKNKDLKETSEIAYRSSFAQFVEYLKLKSITKVTEQDIKEYKQYLTDKKLSVFTIISHMSALKSLFAFLATRNLYPNVAKDIKTPKKPKGFMRDCLTKEQASKLLEIAKGEDVNSKRNYAIISTLIRCGLRSIEIIRADVADVRRVNGGYVLYVHGKGRDSKDEFVLLTDEALRAIRAYLSLRSNLQQEDPLFAAHGSRNNNGRLTTRSIRRMVKACLKDIGLNEKELTCHSLRHTFATLALANNAPLLAVQKAMRHSNINTTTIYTHMIDRFKDGAENFIDI